MFFVTYSIYMLKTDNKLFVFAVRVTKVKGHKMIRQCPEKPKVNTMSKVKHTLGHT